MRFAPAALAAGLAATVLGLTHPYNETLTLQPLRRHHLLSTFAFDTVLEPVSLAGELTLYTVFPPVLGPLLDHVAELRLRFARGWWDAAEWGLLPDQGAFAGGTGVELWAVIHADLALEARARWTAVANGLLGLFCALLNNVGNDNSAVHPGTPGTWVLQAQLPLEPVCTENLTPFLKLVPTRGRAGVALLLDGHTLFDTPWHLLSVDVVRVCGDECRWELSSRVQTVTNVPLALRNRKLRIAHPDRSEELRCRTDKQLDGWTCFPSGPALDASYSIEQLFGQYIKGAASIGRPSTVCVNAPSHWEVTAVLTDGAYSSQIDGCIELPEGARQFDVKLSSANALEVHFEPAPVLVDRAITGLGAGTGGFRTVLTNPTAETLTLDVFETVPWFVRVFMHTRRVWVTGEQDESPELAHVVLYTPAKDRQLPAQIHTRVQVPPGRAVAIAVAFEKLLLQYAEYPPDPNHGFEIAPAVVTVVGGDRDGYTLRLTALLVTLPTPDFSMPYNVIILTSTVLALAFGAVFNMAVRRTVEHDQVPESVPLRNKLVLAVGQVRAKLGL